MDYAKESLKMHYELKGKIEIKSRAAVDSKEALSLAYTPGVAQPCLEIQKDPSKSFDLTRRWNTVAVITDGTAVLGLGDIGPEAGMPVMEGKCVLFKEFGDVDAIPLCVRSKDVDEIVKAVSLFAGSFGGILVHPEDMTPGKEFSGCYENYASVTALIKKACQIDGSLQNGRAIFEALDRSAVFRLVDQWIDEIVYGLVTLVHVLNPSRIVLGGGIMEQPFISMEVRQRLLSLVSPGMRTTEIVRAELGNQAGFLGAAYEAEKLLRLGATGVCAQLPGR